MTNGFPNNTFDSSSTKSYKIIPYIAPGSSSRRAILKQVTTPHTIDFEYLNLINTLVLSWSSIPNDGDDESKLFEELIRGEELNILRKLVFLVVNFDLKEVFFP